MEYQTEAKFFILYSHDVQYRVEIRMDYSSTACICERHSGATTFEARSKKSDSPARVTGIPCYSLRVFNSTCTASSVVTLIADHYALEIFVVRLKICSVPHNFERVLVKF